MTKPVKRHALTTRIWHWVNALSLIVLFMSGLNISNAHPRLYWGEKGFATAEAWLLLPKFPGWATIPNFYSLSAARDWHVLFALIFAFGLLAFMLISLANRHFRRDLVTSPREWRPANIWADVRQHLRLKFDHVGSKFNFLQKVAYGGVIFILLPLMIFTGITMSPGGDAMMPFLVDVFGGRQSARSLHFLAAWGLFIFFVVHVLLVLLSGPIKQMRDMITGGRIDEAA